jgi:hypothetical protein
MSNDKQPDGSQVITFGGKELDPVEEERYLSQIREAKKGGINALKGGDPVGVVPRPAIPLAQKAAREAADLASAIGPDGSVRPRPPGSPVISPETAAMLREASDAAAQQAHEEAQQKGAPAEEKPEEERKADEQILEMFDFQGRNEAERVLNNKKRRAAIEARCEPMNIEDLLLRDEVQQLVPILPGKFEVLFRSMTPEENLFIKQYVAKHDMDKTEQYIVEKFAICQLCCSVLAINTKPFVDHRNAEGAPDEKLFEQKLKQLLKKSGYIIADLGINYMWFDVRVRKLLNPDALGNG